MRIIRLVSILILTLIFGFTAFTWARYSGLVETSKAAGFEDDHEAENGGLIARHPHCQTIAVHAQLRRTGLPTKRSFLHSISRSFDAQIASTFLGKGFCMRYENYYVENREDINALLKSSE